jgi:DNA repair protein RadC
MQYTQPRRQRGPSRPSARLGEHTASLSNPAPEQADRSRNDPASGYHVTIRALPEGERPRERLRDNGPQALSTAELLAIILRVGVEGASVIDVARALLAEFGGLAGLMQADFATLCRVKGMGEAKVAQLKAALELGRRVLATSPEQRYQIRTPADAASLLMMDMAFLEQEHLRVLLLNTKNHVVGSPTIYKGSLNSSVVRVGEIFREAIRQNCAAIIVAHNHPSGDPTPSPEDIAVTCEIIQAGKLLDIDVLDHLVIGHNRYISLRERGLAFQ